MFQEESHGEGHMQRGFKESLGCFNRKSEKYENFSRFASIPIMDSSDQSRDTPVDSARLEFRSARCYLTRSRERKHEATVCYHLPRSFFSQSFTLSQSEYKQRRVDL